MEGTLLREGDLVVCHKDACALQLLGLPGNRSVHLLVRAVHNNGLQHFINIQRRIAHNMGQLTGHPDRSVSKGFILNIDLNRCGFQQIVIDAVLAIRQFVRGFVNEILQIHGTGLFAGDHTGCVADGICLHVGDRAVCYYIALGIHDLPIAFSAVEGQERSEAGIKANQRDIVHIDIISGIQVIFQNLNLIQLGNAVRFIIVMVTNGINLGQRMECCHTGHFCGQIIQLRFHHSAHR